MSVAADKQFPDADAHGKSAEEPLRGITPPALTRSGSEACLALARTHSGLWPDVEKRIAAGFMYQEDGGSYL